VSGVGIREAEAARPPTAPPHRLVEIDLPVQVSGEIVRGEVDVQRDRAGRSVDHRAQAFERCHPLGLVAEKLTHRRLELRPVDIGAARTG
jgi:hypothetical protein